MQLVLRCTITFETAMLDMLPHAKLLGKTVEMCFTTKASKCSATPSTGSVMCSVTVLVLGIWHYMTLKDMPVFHIKPHISFNPGREFGAFLLNSVRFASTSVVPDRSATLYKQSMLPR